MRCTNRFWTIGAAVMAVFFVHILAASQAQTAKSTASAKARIASRRTAAKPRPKLKPSTGFSFPTASATTANEGYDLGVISLTDPEALIAHMRASWTTGKFD